MSEKLILRAAGTEFSINGCRWCSSCSHNKSVVGGAYKIIRQGKNRRWLCEDCLNNTKERANGNWVLIQKEKVGDEQ